MTFSLMPPANQESTRPEMQCTLRPSDRYLTTKSLSSRPWAVADSLRDRPSAAPGELSEYPHNHIMDAGGSKASGCMIGSIFVNVSCSSGYYCGHPVETREPEFSD